jgi:PAS domain S-box-containing protein
MNCWRQSAADVTKNRLSLTDSEQFAAAFEFAPIGMALLDLQSTSLRVNHAMAQMFGYSQGELVGVHTSAIGHPEDLDEDLRLRALMLAGAFPSYERDKRYLHRSGRVVWTHISCSLVHDAQGQPSHFLLQVQDITQRKAAEAALRESEERIREQARQLAQANEALEGRIRQRTAQLEESNRQLRMFAYSLAHDMRAPLASTDGFSRQLELTLGDRLDERSRHYLQRVRAGVQSMSDLTDAMLSLANLSQEPLQHTSVDLSAAARAWLQRTREREPHRQVSVTIEDTPRVQGDARLLGVLMDNLLNNAWKFTSEREDARIAFTASLVNGLTEFSVEDNGAGFDPDYADKLFMPFQRLHHAHEFSGTGMGLAIVHKIVQRHGGRVSAYSVLGQGATFRFMLDGASREEGLL